MRKSWDAYFIEMCDFVSKRATCSRKFVGAIIVRDKRVLSTGYNGALPKMPHCQDVGCDLENNHCVNVIHAECNAIASAAKMGICIDGATLYCNTMPCWNCFKMCISSGIGEIIYKDSYKPDKRILEAVQKIPIIFKQFTEGE